MDGSATAAMASGELSDVSGFEAGGVQTALCRRTFCRTASLSLLGWKASVAMALADQSQDASLHKRKAKSLILLWLNGGPSQLETFDPHPGTEFAGPTRSIATSVPGIMIAEGLPRVAEQMHSLTLIRSMVSQEGDHERGRYLMKTGFRPNPAVVHPSLGAITSARLPVGDAEIPRYVCILSNDRHSQGGYLGEQYDPFRIPDPRTRVPDIVAPVDQVRLTRRIAGLDVVESALRGRNPRIEARSLHRAQISQALQMMDSSQLNAFDVENEPSSVRRRYGETPFGRGCLCARRLIEVGVRCVEVELAGWDTHANNFEGHVENNAILDPAFSALIADLRARELLDSTVVVCAGEFGRTPKINLLDGRDHWPNGFSVVLAGGRFRPGTVIGETDPLGKGDPVDPVNVEDLFATLLASLGIDPGIQNMTPIGRPIRFSDGNPVTRLFSTG